MYKYAFDPDKSNERQYYFNQAKQYEAKILAEEHYLRTQVPESYDHMDIKKHASALNFQINEHELHSRPDKFAALAEAHRLVIQSQNEKQKRSKVNFLEKIKKDKGQLREWEAKNAISIEDAIEMFK